MPLHKNLINLDIHVAHAFTFTDVTARNTVEVVTSDIGKIARQSDDNSYYILIDIIPTWVRIDSKGFDTFLEMTDTPSNFIGNANKVVEVNTGETALQFGQQLRTTDSPTFVQVSVGNTGLIVGTSMPFLDSSGILTLQNIDVLDSITEITIENAINSLPNLVTVQGQNLTVEAASILNQDLTTDANVNFNDLTLAGNLTVNGTTTTIDTVNLLVEDKNIEIGNVSIPTDVTADGGGIILKASVDRTILWINATNAWTFSQNIDLLANNLLTSGAILPGRVIVDNLDLDGNIITTLSGDLDIITNTGGVFKFESNALRAGQSSVDYIELGHNSFDSFINAVGVGGLKFAFNGAVRAIFNNIGHFLLEPSTDQKDILILKTFNNLNETGLAWKNSLSSITQTIYRKDVGSNRADLHFATGLNSDPDLLTDSFKIHGSVANEGRLEVIDTLQISSGNPGFNKILTSDATGVTSWITPTASSGDIVMEIFESTNARFFGELQLPSTQGWTDTEINTGTIVNFSDTVFDIQKNVIKYDIAASGDTTKSELVLTAADWTNILTFGASYSGICRITKDIDTQSIFSGMGFAAGNDPRATSIQSRVGVFISVDATYTTIRLEGTTIVVLDGTSGAPEVLKDKWFSWEVFIDPTPDAGISFGAATLYVNGAQVAAGSIASSNNAVNDEISIANSSGSGQTTFYVDNFGVTIYEDSDTKTLAAATISASVAQINIPEGRRDYTIILPDGNPRNIGDILRLVANNVSGSITLKNQNPSVPEILYNGLRELKINVFVKEVIEGINTINGSNVYLGFKLEDIDRTETIYAQLSSSVDQIPGSTNPQVITYNTQDAINGIGHSTILNTGELEILPGFGGIYFVSPQPQVGKDQGATGVDFDMFLQVDRGSGFVDELNSNIKLTIKDQDITDVIVSAFTILVNDKDKIRLMQKVSNSGVGMGLKNTDPVVGPPTVPRTPSIIFTMYRIGGI